MEKSWCDRAIGGHIGKRATGGVALRRVRQVDARRPPRYGHRSPVVELDALLWSEDLTTPTPQRWAEIQRDLVRAPEWILDGDLGPYDVLDVRLRAADTVVLLDLSLLRCAWRALRRSRERADFWWWLLAYRRRWRPGRWPRSTGRGAARAAPRP